jgi:molybdate transport system substrate-binding protein
MKRSTIFAALAGLAIVLASAAKADDLVILSAAAVRPALVQLPATFEKASGHRVSVTFGNATAINTKVVAGERVDIVILPPRQLTALIQDGHLLAGGRADLGIVRLGVAVRAGSAAMAVGTPDDFKQALLSAASFGMPDPADGSTSSQHMVKVLAQLGVAEAMRPKIHAGLACAGER